MRPWLIFTLGSMLLTVLALGGFTFARRSKSRGDSAYRPAEDTRFLYLLLWLASLSVMAYIAFAFGKR
jgi:hypothetical protein